MFGIIAVFAGQLLADGQRPKKQTMRALCA